MSSGDGAVGFSPYASTEKPAGASGAPERGTTDSIQGAKIPVSKPPLTRVGWHDAGPTMAEEEEEVVVGAAVLLVSSRVVLVLALAPTLEVDVSGTEREMVELVVVAAAVDTVELLLERGAT